MQKSQKNTSFVKMLIYEKINNKRGIFINKLYNTQKNISSDLTKFFKKVTNITKPQEKIIPYIILGMIEAESVVTTDIVKKLKGDFSLVYPSSTVRRLERFFNNEKFDVYNFYDDIIKETLSKYKPKNKNVYISIDHMFCRDAFTVLFFSLKVDKQRHTTVVSML